MGALEANEIMEYLFYFMMWWFYSHRKICVIDTRKIKAKNQVQSELERTRDF